MRKCMFGVVVAALAVFLAAPVVTSWAQEEGTGESAPEPLVLSGTVNVGSFLVHRSFFGGNPNFGSRPEDSDFGWMEGFARLQLDAAPAPWVTATLGAATSFTGATDYWGLRNDGAVLIDQARVDFKSVAESDFSVAVGRQDIVIGDGFIIGDGYLDHEGALWTIPFSFFDAVRADYERGPLHVTAMGALLSSSFSAEVPDPDDPAEVIEAEADGQIYGLDVSYAWAEKATAGLGFFMRDDDGTGNNASVAALRGSYTFPVLTLAGEFAMERGDIGDVDLNGYAFHLDAIHTFNEERETYAKASYLLFSGDDADTEENEGYYPWFYRWNDWSQYYVGDVVGSTMLFNSDVRMMVLEGGTKPGEAWGLRFLFHRYDLDTAAGVGGLPDGTGKHFADELDLVADYTLNDFWSFWAMVAYAKPGEAAKAVYGDDDATEFFLNATFGF